MKKNILNIILVGGLLAGVASCNRDYLDTELNSTFSDEQLSTSDAGLQGLVDGIYTKLRSYAQANAAGHEDFGHKAILSGLDLMSNDVFMHQFHWFGFHYDYRGRVQTSSRSKLMWNTYYPVIKIANNIINNIKEDNITAEFKPVLGQALTIRALSYFMLARVFGPTYINHQNDLCVPINTDNSGVKEGKPRAKVSEVYDLIVSDLEKSVKYLDGYVRPNKEKIDQTVAQSILAQVYLEMGKYKEAAEMANKAKSKYPILTEEQYRLGFYDLVTVPDAMWGAIINAENTSFVASFFSHFDSTSTGGYSKYAYKSIDKRLYDAIPTTDYRKSLFVAPGMDADAEVIKGVKKGKIVDYANVKFIDPTIREGDYIYMRAAELYYIEAEALARSGNEVQARQVLYDITKTRDTGYKLSTKIGAELIDEIILQKRIELWGEGSAWFDMKRLGVGLDRTYEGTNHPTFGRTKIEAGHKDFLFQIPQSEIDTNPNIVQNP